MPLVTLVTYGTRLFLNTRLVDLSKLFRTRTYKERVNLNGVDCTVVVPDQNLFSQKL